ncbi:MAG: peptide-methionine (S)-S-oxide reductase MsrA [Balneolales bacterium]
MISFKIIPLILFAGLTLTTGLARETDVNINTKNKSMEQATFGAGCFWCVEAIFLRLKGVKDVVSGYSGGEVKNPTYQQVTSGNTGHAEVIQVTYDPSEITYEQLLNVFWRTHDPTTLNRQGADVGTQYRSAVFYHNEEQRKIAKHFKARLNEEKIYNASIVTEITPFDTFYEAEEYHQNYFAKNPEQAYCQVVIVPKLEKMEVLFKEKLKAH